MKQTAPPQKSLKTLNATLIAALSGLLLLSPTVAKESPEFADKVIQEHGIQGAQAERLRRLLTQGYGLTRNIGTEDPDAFIGPNNSYHPVSRAQCRERVLDKGLIKSSAKNQALCQAKWMVPVPGVDGKPTLCMDQFEFPNIPCEYPLVWVPSQTAHQICQSMGKRLCNSHEWEGACAGAVQSIDSYRFDIGNDQARREAVNQAREKVWAFQHQPEYAERTRSQVLCAVYSGEDPDVLPEARANLSTGSIPGLSLNCAPDKSAYKTCGTNSWPSGYKHECVSRQGVYDLHGNLAEVVNLPSHKGNIARGTVTGLTERKGSFFVDRSGLKGRGGVQKYPDDCRVRQPYEHTKEISKDTGHSFYQEGFRCCKDVP
jgi:formylglycine-generating enzyme required for sulfatase activity